MDLSSFIFVFWVACWSLQPNLFIFRCLQTIQKKGTRVRGIADYLSIFFSLHINWASSKTCDFFHNEPTYVHVPFEMQNVNCPATRVGFFLVNNRSKKPMVRKFLIVSSLDCRLYNFHRVVWSPGHYQRGSTEPVWDVILWSMSWGSKDTRRLFRFCILMRWSVYSGNEMR